jgi:uncharacterized protein with PQ loop repeat
MIDLIGWIASAVLLATLVRQIAKQVRQGGEGVSTWLFLGQATASTLFIVYSALLDNWVFIVTNSLILATAVAGQWLTWRRRRKTDSSGPEVT